MMRFRPNGAIDGSIVTARVAKASSAAAFEKFVEGARACCRLVSAHFSEGSCHTHVYVDASAEPRHGQEGTK